MFFYKSPPTPLSQEGRKFLFLLDKGGGPRSGGGFFQKKKKSQPRIDWLFLTFEQKCPSAKLGRGIIAWIININRVRISRAKTKWYNADEKVR